MGSLAIDIFCSSSIFESQSSSLQIHEGKSLDAVDFLNNNKFSAYCNHNIPKPPPLPRKNLSGKLSKYCRVPKETKDVWEKLFKEGYGADVHVVSEDGKIIAAHYSILSVASPVLGNFLQQSKLKNGTRYLTIPGVPYDAIYAFICFLYSSCYEEEEMKKFVLHLLVLSHCYVVPPLKRACEQFLESGWLTKENVIDVLQLARTCDAPRLSLVCLHMVVRDFKPISITEAWKVMKRANPCLEQELLEFVVEADSRKEEREKKIEEKKVYLQLHEAMEALVHICREECRKIGPCSKVLNKNQGACAFQACKGLEILIRHFSGCKTRVPGGCVHCKRMWQLLELHSRICTEPENCKVPLCRHFKEKMQQQSKKDKVKWEILVYKVMAARNAQKLFSSLRSSF